MAAAAAPHALLMESFLAATNGDAKQHLRRASIESAQSSAPPTQSKPTNSLEEELKARREKMAAQKQAAQNAKPSETPSVTPQTTKAHGMNSLTPQTIKPTNTSNAPTSRPPSMAKAKPLSASPVKGNSPASKNALGGLQRQKTQRPEAAARSESKSGTPVEPTAAPKRETIEGGQERDAPLDGSPCFSGGEVTFRTHIMMKAKEENELWVQEYAKKTKQKADEEEKRLMQRKEEKRKLMEEYDKRQKAKDAKRDQERNEKREEKERKKALVEEAHAMEAERRRVEAERRKADKAAQSHPEKTHLVVHSKRRLRGNSVALAAPAAQTTQRRKSSPSGPVNDSLSREQLRILFNNIASRVR